MRDLAKVKEQLEEELKKKSTDYKGNKMTRVQIEDEDDSDWKTYILEVRENEIHGFCFGSYDF